MNKTRSKTLVSIALYIGITMLVIVVSLSGILYTILEKKGLDIVEKSNAELLNEVGYHLSYMNQVNVNFCYQQFNDSDVQSVVTATAQPNSFNVTQTMRRIGKSLTLNEMVESVILYNGRADVFYSTDPIVYSQCLEMVELLRKDTSFSTLFVIPRKIWNEGLRAYDHEVLTYVMTERDLRTGAVESAVAINISTKWMLNNLATTQQAKNGHLILVRTDGRILLDTQNISLEEKYVEGALLENLKKENKGSLIRNMNGSRIVVSFSPVPQTEWILLNMQPYDTLFAFASETRNIILLVTVLSLLIGTILTLLVAKVIYRPFGMLFHHVSAQYANAQDAMPDAAVAVSNNEMNFILHAFERQQENLQKLEDYRWSSEVQLQKSQLKTALLENGTHTLSPLAHIGGQTQETFEKGDRVIVALLVIGNFRYTKNDNVEDRNLVRFAVSNVAEEIMQPYGFAQAVPMCGGEVVVLVRPKNGQHDMELYRQLLKKIAENLYDILDIMVSAFFDTSTFSSPSLSECYHHLQQLSRYTLIYDLRCILTAQELSAQQKMALAYPQVIERKLFEAITTANAEDAAAQIKIFMRTISEGSVESYLACVTKLELALQTHVNQLNTNKLIKVQVDFRNSFAQIQRAETSEQICNQFTTLIAAIIEQTPYSAGRKNETMVNAIRQFIEEHYQEKSLCGKMLAGSFDVSTAYMGRLFKESIGVGVQEYINHVRLEHAQTMVVETNLQISQIVEMCGLETSSFYRLYKSCFGVSPKEQRMQNRLQTEIQTENKE